MEVGQKQQDNNSWGAGQTSMTTVGERFEERRGFAESPCILCAARKPSLKPGTQSAPPRELPAPVHAHGGALAGTSPLRKPRSGQGHRDKELASLAGAGRGDPAALRGASPGGSKDGCGPRGRRHCGRPQIGALHRTSGGEGRLPPAIPGQRFSCPCGRPVWLSIFARTPNLAPDRFSPSTGAGRPSAPRGRCGHDARARVPGDAGASGSATPARPAYHDRARAARGSDEPGRPRAGGTTAPTMLRAAAAVDAAPPIRGRARGPGAPRGL